MCHFCTQHADGGKWFEAAQNYAAKMYQFKKKAAKAKEAEYIEKKKAELQKMREKGALIEEGEGWYMDDRGEFYVKPGAALDLDIMVTDLVQEVIEAKALNLDELPMLKKKAKSFMDKYHTGQVVTYEEAQQMLEITWPIGLMECICRRERRGMYNDPMAHTWFSLGVGLYKWERWPETFRGITFLSVEEAKERLAYFNKKGCVHTLWTFYTPYIGGLCNCEYPTCLGIRGRVDYGIDGILYKGEYVIVPIPDRCTGCAECVKFCQFGAMSMSRSRNKVTVNMQKCFGCGQCLVHCPNTAFKLLEREKALGVRDHW